MRFFYTCDGTALVTAVGGNSGEGIIATGVPVTGGLLTVDIPEQVKPAFFMGGCGAAGFGGPMPLLAPLLALAAAIALMRRRRV